MRRSDSRRGYIRTLISEYGGQLTAEFRRELAIQYGCSEQTIYNDTLYILSDSDNDALLRVVRIRLSNENAAARRANIVPALELCALTNLFIEQDGMCAECGEMERRIDLHIEHIKPLSVGGAHHIDNIQLLCAQCNTQKSYLWEHPDGRKVRVFRALLTDPEFELVKRELSAGDRGIALVEAANSKRQKIS